MVRFSRERRDEPGYHLGKCKVLFLTEKAIRVEVLDGPHKGLGAEGGEACWLPKTQIHPDSEINDTSFLDVEGEAVMTDWIARQKGWK
jgi:hypothetical protein